MSEENIGRRFQQIRLSLLAVYGVVVSLLVMALFGDLRYFAGEAPAGWFTLWFLTTVAGISMGVFLLVGRTWRRLPLKERRGPAMGYLLAGFVNSLSLVVFTSMSGSPEGVCFIVPAGYALGLFLAYARVYTLEDRVRDETFP